MTDVDGILVGISRREEMARTASAGSWTSYFGRVRLNNRDFACITSGGKYSDPPHIAANDPTHVLTVLDAAREELTDALSQRERHSTDGTTCDVCGGVYDSHPDAEQADRTLARLAVLYGATP